MKTRYCEICNKEFQIIGKGWIRKFCFTCAPHEDESCSHSQAVAIKRRAIKNMLVERAGGKCVKCDYDKSIRALEFHHKDPSKKDFGLSKNLTKNIEELKKRSR